MLTTIKFHSDEAVKELPLGIAAIFVDEKMAQYLAPAPANAVKKIPLCDDLFREFVEDEKQYLIIRHEDELMALREFKADIQAAVAKLSSRVMTDPNAVAVRNEISAIEDAIKDAFSDACLDAYVSESEAEDIVKEQEDAA